MSLSRREILRMAAILGVTPLSLGLMGCDDTTADPENDLDGAHQRDLGVDSDGSLLDDAGEGFDAEADGEILPDAAPDDLPIYEHEGDLGPETLFEHGVASGDPLSDALIIWTRASVDTDSQLVWWEIATDVNFIHRVEVGEVEALEDADWTVKIDVTELDPATTYYYRFKALGRTSAIGRGRTAPDGDVDRVRLGLVSCSSGGHGYFHVYQSLAQQPDLDAVVHLGDYIYEYGSFRYGLVRELDPPHEIVSLDDYRRRYRWYRQDAACRAVHQQHAFIMIWDDHEIANNGWRDGGDNHDEDEGDWSARKAVGQQAFHEWLPIRETGDRSKIFRQIQYGNLVDLLLLDTRYFDRDEQDGENRLDEDRSLLGDEQELWLNETLAASTTTWRVLGQQVMMGQLLLGGNPLNDDQWDGYDASRRRLYQTIRDTPVDNIVVLTGDIHSSWANELTEDPLDPMLYNKDTGEGSVGVEFVVPAVTSPGLDLPGGDSPAIRGLLEGFNPHIKYFETGKRGYVILDISEERAQANWYNFETITEVEVEPEYFAAAYFVANGEARLQQADGPSATRRAPALAPEE